MKRFNVIDESFICKHCGKEVSKLNYTARDHCPYCLNSIHVDNNPGDRSANCDGNLIPIGIEKSVKHDYKIIYKCDQCGAIKKNIMANDDNMDLIIELSTKPQNYE